MPPPFFLFCKAPVEPSCPWLNIDADISLQRLPPRACRRSTVYQYYIRTETRPQKHEKEMCASIHLSFKMEALKNSTRRLQACALTPNKPKMRAVFMSHFFCNTSHRNSTNQAHTCAWSNYDGFWAASSPSMGFSFEINCCADITLWWNAVKQIPVFPYLAINRLFLWTPYITPWPLLNCRSKCENAYWPFC